MTSSSRRPPCMLFFCFFGFVFVSVCLQGQQALKIIKFSKTHKEMYQNPFEDWFSFREVTFVKCFRIVRFKLWGNLKYLPLYHHGCGSIIFDSLFFFFYYVIHFIRKSWFNVQSLGAHVLNLQYVFILRHISKSLIIWDSGIITYTRVSSSQGKCRIFLLFLQLFMPPTGLLFPYFPKFNFLKFISRAFWDWAWNLEMMVGQIGPGFLWALGYMFWDADACARAPPVPNIQFKHFFNTIWRIKPICLLPLVTL